MDIAGYRDGTAKHILQRRLPHARGHSGVVVGGSSDLFLDPRAQDIDEQKVVPA